jgi:hypothetical protein
MVAADAAMVVALAGSFFSLDPEAARSQMLLYLLVSFAPLAVVAPLIGPFVDSVPGGRRTLVKAIAVARIVLYIVMMFNLHSKALFPLVFAVMVLQKTYGASKSAIVPMVVNNQMELVEANAKLGLLGGVAGGLAAAPCAVLAWIAAPLSLGFGVIMLALSFVLAAGLPKGVVASRRAQRPELIDLRSSSVLLAASAMALIRAAVGFLFFHVLFFIRDNDYSKLWLAAVAGSVTLGSMAGNALSPALRRSVREEHMLVGALACVSFGGLLAVLTGGPVAAVLLALLVHVSAAVARLAFESTVQRDAPGANQGRAFAKFEARFQLFWVAAAVLAVLLTPPARLGFLVVCLLGAFAAVTYLIGARAVRAGMPIPESIGSRARRSVQQEVARRRDPSLRQPRPPLPDASTPTRRAARPTGPPPQLPPPRRRP